MTVHQVVIMAQGQQTRLPELRHPKHLLRVDGEPILMRTLRLLIPLLDPGVLITIVGPPELGAAVFDLQEYRTVVSQLERPGSCVVTGIRAALQLPTVAQQRTAVLLGDVVWSQAALAAVIADPRPLVFCGTPVLTASQGEVFAVVFDDPQGVSRLCETCPCVKPRWRQMQGGHLRRLLWHAMFEARLVQRTRGASWWHADLYLPISDWTTDIDKPADVARLPELGKLAAHERIHGPV